jgi:hypothetical protein
MPTEIQTRDTSNQEAADLRLIPHTLTYIIYVIAKARVLKLLCLAPLMKGPDVPQLI